MAILNITVPNLEEVLSSYNYLRIYKSSTETGTFSVITSLPLNIQDSYYTYNDLTGLTTDWYKTSYYNSTTNVESTLSVATLADVAATSQLGNSWQILLTLASTIKTVTGKSLTYTEYSFFTAATPFYTTVRSIKLAYGAYIKDIPDYLVYMAIYEASLMADAIGSSTAGNELFIFARKQWVTCKVAEMLLSNSITNSLQSKKLDNFSVTYNGAYGKDIKDKIDACLTKWEEVLVSGSSAMKSFVGVVKGQYDPDEKRVGRLWEHGQGIKSSGSNGRFFQPGKRRLLHSWNRNKF